MKGCAFCALMAAFAAAPPALPQSTQAAAAQAPVGGPAFEVASMKVAASPGLGPAGTGYAMTGGPGSTMPGRWTCTSVPIDVLISQGWGDEFRLAGISARPDAPRFDIVATIPPGTSMGDFHLMVRRLLRERLGLVTHTEQREVTVEELVVAKGGIKMKDAEPAPPGAVPPPRQARAFNQITYPVQTPGVTLDKDGIPQVPPGFPMIVQAATKSGLMVVAGRMLTSAQIASEMPFPRHARPEDKTGLTGKYDFTLKYDPRTLQRPGTAGEAVPEASEPGLTIESALKDQLGLEFRKGKTMADFLVVDSFNRTPTEN